MDSAILIKPASGGNAAQYGYVDKRPSILPWELKPQSEWMNSAQKTWVLPYAILTLVAIAIAFTMWVIENIYFNSKKFFCKVKKSSSADTSSILFSQLTGVHMYLPVHQVGPNKYFIVNTEGMLLRHLEDSLRCQQEDSNFDLMELVPIEFRSKVLGIIKWYPMPGDVVEEGAKVDTIVSKEHLYKKSSFNMYASSSTIDINNGGNTSIMVKNGSTDSEIGPKSIKPETTNSAKNGKIKINIKILPV